MPRQRRQSRAGQGDVPTDSMSDIAFLLIIFFLVATTLVKVRGFEAVLAGHQRRIQQQRANGGAQDQDRRQSDLL